LVFFLAFFFFVAMIVILGVCDEPTARLVQSQAKSRFLGPRPLTAKKNAITRSSPQSEKRK
jgi:hypothetical protein